MRLSWTTPGDRYFDSGVDRGVLFANVNAGVAWVGLISVAESPTGGDARPFYQDGVKYLSRTAKEDFEATVTAFSAPKEFSVCDGAAAVQTGLFATQQPRKPFGLSYRTRVGNDIDGQEHAYKIHLIYNAVVAPSSRDNKTSGSDVEPNTLSWAISALPPTLTGRKPTAHFFVDSRWADPVKLAAFETILYGSDVAEARLPSVAELSTIFAPTT